MVEINIFPTAVLALSGLGLLVILKRFLVRKKINKLRDKVVVITGASSGVGEACAHAFYRCGCKVILCSRRKQELERVKEQLMCLQLKTETHIPIVITLDLEDTDDLPARAIEMLECYGRVDVLINNGGISYRGVARETDIDIDRKVMNINYFGAVALTKALLSSMVYEGSGHIVAVSSIQGRMAIPFRSAYTASKFALQAFCDSLRAEVADSNIAVTVISPSYINTNLSLNAVCSDGSRHGVMDSTTASGMSTEYIAKRILWAVATKEKDVILGPIDHKIAVHLRNLWPSLYFWIMKLRAKKGSKGED
ncbi:dehydrogenase/reductase SDR family protein 7-like [Anneissia japonica]|uniref:dehydrogenase/reductase SDR family protein 7-like n=1 Tax=Anneissia japonica TaxID=1529436 RepID=UPI00142555B4|nr:dehydrogenase/reductase SDR family protein 7-like [Anneissia japonica]